MKSFTDIALLTAMLSSSVGVVGTFLMVSFRPSVEPMPMDASDLTLITSCRSAGVGQVLLLLLLVGVISGERPPQSSPPPEVGEPSAILTLVSGCEPGTMTIR